MINPKCLKPGRKLILNVAQVYVINRIINNVLYLSRDPKDDDTGLIILVDELDLFDAIPMGE